VARRVSALRGLSIVAAAALALNMAPARATTLAIAVSGDDGVGTSLAPGVSCANGGTGASWHYDYTGSVPAGRFSSLPADLRLHLNLHSEADSLIPTPTYSNAFLLGEQSEVWLSNPRGAVRLVMKAGSGTCADKPLGFDGTTVTGVGSWRVVSGSGSYRNTTGFGDFSLSADVAPGGDNPYSLQLEGDIAVVKPSITAQAIGASWGNLRLNYLSRVVTVAYRVTNTGPGDSYGPRVTGVTALTPGVTPQLAPGQTLQLGDLPAGQSATFAISYRLGTGSPPCTAVVVDCTFTSRLTFEVPDALDQPLSPAPTATLTTTAPLLPL
jgi:hypothetical protein